MGILKLKTEYSRFVHKLALTHNIKGSKFHAQWELLHKIIILAKNIRLQY